MRWFINFAGVDPLGDIKLCTVRFIYVHVKSPEDVFGCCSMMQSSATKKLSSSHPLWYAGGLMLLCSPCSAIQQEVNHQGGHLTQNNCECYRSRKIHYLCCFMSKWCESVCLSFWKIKTDNNVIIYNNNNNWQDDNRKLNTTFCLKTVTLTQCFIQINHCSLQARSHIQVSLHAT